MPKHAILTTPMEIIRAWGFLSGKSKWILLSAIKVIPHTEPIAADRSVLIVMLSTRIAKKILLMIIAPC